MGCVILIDSALYEAREENRWNSSSLRGVNTKISENGHFVSKITKRR